MALANKPVVLVKRKPGRPKAAAEPVAVSRQERRHRARMIEKAAEAWRLVTKGSGVVLVDGLPVDPKGGSESP